MAIISNTYERGDANNVPEQVENAIYMFEREETPIFSNSAKEKAETTSPEWLSDSLRAASTNALVEGGALTATARVSPTRVKNLTQIFTETISVTGTNEAVNKYGGYKSELGYQMEKATRAVKRDIEKQITSNRASVANVSDTTAGELGGLETWIETNVSRGSGGSNGGYSNGVTTTATDGTQRALTLDLILNVAKTGYDNGARFNQIQTGSFNKLKISSMSGNATRTSQEKNMISNTITVLETDFGKFTAMINPQMRTRSLFMIDPSNIKIMNLRPFTKVNLAKTNDSTEKALLTELTTKVVEKGLGGVFDLTTA